MRCEVRSAKALEPNNGKIVSQPPPPKCRGLWSSLLSPCTEIVTIQYSLDVNNEKIRVQKTMLAIGGKDIRQQGLWVNQCQSVTLMLQGKPKQFQLDFHIIKEIARQEKLTLEKLQPPRACQTEGSGYSGSALQHPLSPAEGKRGEVSFMTVLWQELAGTLSLPLCRNGS